MILGLVLAGGQSTRFGSDKALALLEGRPLIEHAVERLTGWCDETWVVGRADAPAPTLPDWPRPGLGPLGGLAAGLRHAHDRGFDAVLSVGVDSLHLPDELLSLLDPAPACLAAQPVVGLWPASAAETLAAMLDGGGSRAMYAFAEAIGAHMVELEHEPANVNTPGDLPGR